MIPLHPSIVHFPIVLAGILPLLVLAFAYMIRADKMAPQGWLIIIGLQVLTVASGYIALETGETDEHIVTKAVSKDLVHAHEEAAKIFVGVSVLALVISIGVFFLRKDLQLYVHLTIVLVNLLAGFLAYRTSQLGGALVYIHGAGSVHSINSGESGSRESQGLLPTPGQNTSESPYPVDENESLKVDDHEYGGTENVMDEDFQPEE